MTQDSNYEIPAQPDPIVLIERAPVHCPKRLMLPANVDTNGRVWPAGGLQHTVTLSLKDLQDAGVEVRWQTPDNDIIPTDVGTLLVAARQADWDSGYRPAFAQPAHPPVTASGSEKA